MRQTLLVFFLFCCYSALAQVKIHAHNDYEKPDPLVNALKQKVFSVEADVYPIGNSLFVAHNKADIDSTRTLSSLYLRKIVSLFKENNGFVTPDSSYRLALVIDIKENFDKTVGQLIKLLEPDLKLFDRSVNPNAVQIIISGDRGSIDKWTSHPPYLYFDGRPAEKYDPPTLNRVAMISDSYAKYAVDVTRLGNVVSSVHGLGKPLRFWGALDNQATWKFLHSKGVDIINSDRVEECTRYFKALAASAN